MLEFHPPRNLTTLRIDKLILNCHILSFYSDCYLCKVGATPSRKLTKTAKMRYRAADVSLILQGFANHIDKLFCLLLLGFKNSIGACIRKSKLCRIKSDDVGANERKIHSRKKLSVTALISSRSAASRRRPSGLPKTPRQDTEDVCSARS